MAETEISGVIELGKAATLGGYRIEVTETKHPRKFFLRITPGRRRVKHRRPVRRSLDEPPKPGQD